MFRTLTFAALLVSLLSFAGTAEALMTLHPLESPNKDFKIVIAHGPFGPQFCFAVFYKGELIAKAYHLAFEVDEDDQFPATPDFTLRHLDNKTEGPVPKPSKFTSKNGGFREGESVRDSERGNYNEGNIMHRKKKEGVEETIPAPGGRMNPDDYEDLVKIVFRAYDDGIAYRYEIARNTTFTIKNELTEFVFPDDYTVEGTAGSLSKISKGTASPLVITIPDGQKLSFGEVPLEDFPDLKFQPGRKWSGTFNNLFDGHGKIDRTGKRTAVTLLLDENKMIQGIGGTYCTPWRFIKIAADDAANRGLPPVFGKFLLPY